jgi:hypothetical protein
VTVGRVLKCGGAGKSKHHVWEPRAPAGLRRYLFNETIWLVLGNGRQGTIPSKRGLAPSRRKQFGGASMQPSCFMVLGWYTQTTRREGEGLL